MATAEWLNRLPASEHRILTRKGKKFYLRYGVRTSGEIRNGASLYATSLVIPHPGSRTITNNRSN